MIEKRGLPLGGVVAIGAERDTLRSRELTAMNVGMAFLALRRGLGEVHVGELRFQVWRLVAVDATHGAMGDEESELRLGVIEAREVVPVLGGMAGFAACRSAVATQLFHALGELATVRVLVTGGAGKFLEVINRGGLVAGRSGNGLSSAQPLRRGATMPSRRPRLACGNRCTGSPDARRKGGSEFVCAWQAQTLTA